MRKKNKIVHMVTAASSVHLMKGQLSYLVNHDYDVNVICSKGNNLEAVEEEEKVHIEEIDMNRYISPFEDLISLFKIIKYFVKIKPYICNAGTPKAGLLGMIASYITRVPVRIYTVRGLIFEGNVGVKRFILLFTEKIACKCATKVVCISPSIQEVLVENNITQKEKTIVFGKGSSNGIQVENFKYNEIVKLQVNEILESKKLNKYDFIIGYVGRINKSKGIQELVNAFEILQKKYNNIALILIGRKETEDCINKEIENKIITNKDIIEIGFEKNPIPYYYIMDILAFPTYREGFGNVSIEAQATGTPVITTNVTGAKDTVVDNVTGILIDARNEEQLAIGIEKFINDPKLKKEMGIKAKERAIKDFDSKIIWSEINKFYDCLTK